MPTIKTPVRALKPGDTIAPTVPGEPAFVVLCVATVNHGPVGLSLGRLGEVPPHLERVATVSWQPDALVDVDRPDLTATQAAGDEMLDIIKQVVAHRRESPANNPGMARAIDIMQRLEPPRLPGIEEIVAALADVVNKRAGADQAAEQLLDRARAAGMLPPQP